MWARESLNQQKHKKEPNIKDFFHTITTITQDIEQHNKECNKRLFVNDSTSRHIDWLDPTAMKTW